MEFDVSDLNLNERYKYALEDIGISPESFTSLKSEQNNLLENITYNILSGQNIVLYGNDYKWKSELISDLKDVFKIKLKQIDFNDDFEGKEKEWVVSQIKDIYEIEFKKTTLAYRKKEYEGEDSIWLVIKNLAPNSLEIFDEILESNKEYSEEETNINYKIEYKNDSGEKINLFLPKSFRIIALIDEKINPVQDLPLPLKNKNFSFIPVRVSKNKRKQRSFQNYKLSGVEKNDFDGNLPRNMIVYGAPGTGKSFLLEEIRKDNKENISCNFKHDKLYRRVTFHPGYSYNKFVGNYKPISEGENIKYKFVPGPFLELLCYARQNPEHNFLLLIEEINRANVAEVFGDIFQLLDRVSSQKEGEDKKGESEYPIVFSEEIMNFLYKNNIVSSRTEQVKIPHNLYIWATMNSSDQGVMPLDTAFKRRWNFKHIKLNENEDETREWEIELNFLAEEDFDKKKSIKWNQFRSIINKRLKEKNIPEDKLIGPFFLSEEEMQNNSDAFKNKLLMYLREDVLRHNYNYLFKNDLYTFSDIIEAYENGENIFIKSVYDKLKNKAGIN